MLPQQTKITDRVVPDVLIRSSCQPLPEGSVPSGSIRPVRFLARLLLNAIGLGLATWIVPGIRLDAGDLTRSIVVLVCVALVFGAVNAVVKPIFRFFTNPLIWLTLGLFLLVVNTLMLWLTSWIADRLQLGWSVAGFWAAFFGALIVSVVSVVLGFIVPEKDRSSRKR